jgi:hypothetical protein
MRNEDRLIRIFSSTDPGARTAAAAGIIASGPDWSYILDASKREKTACLLYENLRRSGGLPAVAPGVATELEKIYYANAARNAVIWERSARIIAGLNAISIRPIALKGVFLSEFVYHNIALRPATDIDLLIKREELPAANAALASMGYKAPPCYGDLVSRRAPLCINSLLYDPPGAGDPAVHLHWHIINSTWPLERLAARIDMGSFCAGAREISVGRSAAFMLGPESLMIYLCHHAFHHSFENLITACDIAEAAKEHNEAIGWSKVADAAARSGLSLTVYSALRTAGMLLDVVLSGIEEVAATLTAAERSVSDRISGRRDYASAYRAYLYMERGISSRLRFVARTVVPDRAVIAQGLSVRFSDIGPSHYARRILSNASHINGAARRCA